MEGQKEMQFQKVKRQAETKATSCTIYQTIQSSRDEGSLPPKIGAEEKHYQITNDKWDVLHF